MSYITHFRSRSLSAEYDIPIHHFPSCRAQTILVFELFPGLGNILYLSMYVSALVYCVHLCLTEICRILCFLFNLPPTSCIQNAQQVTVQCLA